MSLSLKKLAGRLYSGCPGVLQQGNLPPPLRDGSWRFFSYGRHAFFEALVLAGVKKGDTVLLPEYICKEVVSAVNVLGAQSAYYPVGTDLQPLLAFDRMPPARAVLAINYFGFPQDLSIFKSYCSNTGATLIEDNAHGFLSRDESGAYLGTRGDIGIFSFRKSLPLLNGSGLVVNKAELLPSLPPQLPYVAYPQSRIFRIKKLLRHLPDWNMTWLLYWLIGLDRKIRILRTGTDYVQADSEAEFVLPENKEPDASLLSVLKSLDADCEISRRRSLYFAIENLVKEHGGVPVFPRLEEMAVPYGFPFYAPLEKIGQIRGALNRHYLNCYLWPELPSEIEPRAREYYKSVWLVNFIW